MFTRLGRLARKWIAGSEPWTNVYGFARSLLAISTALTLVFSNTATLFRPGAGIPEAPVCDGPRGIGLFCLVPASRLEVARWAVVLALLVVASGWRPRVTGALHWWISFSFQANALVLDGGDTVASVLTLLLLPVTLTDARKWHWQAPRGETPKGIFDELRLILASVALTAVRVQVAGIYFHAAVAKFSVEEWSNGTIIYYVFTNPTFGAAGWRRELLWPILMSGTAVTLLTWSILALECLLSAGLVMPKCYRGPLLVAGIIFHAGILVVHGLCSFALAMFAALFLYLRPPELQINFGRLGRLVSGLGAAREKDLSRRFPARN